MASVRGPVWVSITNPVDAKATDGKNIAAIADKFFMETSSAFMFQSSGAYHREIKLSSKKIKAGFMEEPAFWKSNRFKASGPQISLCS
jgi:hypothetical protein